MGFKQIVSIFMCCEIFSVIIDGNCRGRKRKDKRVKRKEHPMDAVHRVTEAAAAAAVISGSANDGCKL